MPTRNGGTFITRQIETILSQLGPGDELIISDDSSTDDTLDRIRQFPDKRVSLYEGNRYFSPVFNMENALRKASGEIIVLSDQDDVWMESKLAVVRREFDRAPKGIKLIVLDGEIVDEQERVLHGSIFSFVGSRKGLIRNIYRNTYMGCCMAFSRELLEIALPFPRKAPMHDMWLGLLAELFGTVDFIPVKTIKYRRHDASVTNLRFRLDVPRQISRRFHLVVSLLKRCMQHAYRRASSRTTAS
jgi:glycosyltransferase involved in cell wall biosynthesis